MSDSVGGSRWDGTLHHDAKIMNGSLVLDKTDDYRNFTTGSHASLPNGALGNSSSISFEMWVDIDQDNKDFCKLFQFGDPLQNCPSAHCFRMKNTGFLCCALCSGGWNGICTDQVFNGSKLHFIYSIDPSGVNTIYVNGEAIVSKVQNQMIPGRRSQDILLLGAAPVLDDYTLWGSIHEFRIWNGIFRESAARVSYQIGPDHVNNR